MLEKKQEGETSTFLDASTSPGPSTSPRPSTSLGPSVSLGPSTSPGPSVSLGPSTSSGPSVSLGPSTSSGPSVLPGLSTSPRPPTSPGPSVSLGPSTNMQVYEKDLMLVVPMSTEDSNALAAKEAGTLWTGPQPASDCKECRERDSTGVFLYSKIFKERTERYFHQSSKDLDMNLEQAWT
eukprot:superscaffoldBa00008325_g23256